MRLAPLAALLLVAGCSLLARSAPVQDRYFTPELTSAVVTAQKGATALRLGRVASSAVLRDRIVHRDSPVELGKYETYRWTDDPAVFVREALHRALFDRGPLRETDENLPVLDVDVLAFEEVRHGSARAGRVQLRWTLHDAKGFVDGMVTSEQPARSDDMEAIVLAISAALRDAAAKVAVEVSSRLR